MWHFNYLDEEICTDAFIQSMCTRNYRKAIIKTFKRLTNFENSPMSKTDKNKFCIEVFKTYFICQCKSPTHTFIRSCIHNILSSVLTLCIPSMPSTCNILLKSISSYYVQKETIYSNLLKSPGYCLRTV